ncbi:hypothetical protein [Catenulispora subtropica]|uniref:WD40 domain protein beta Propeller n=1 Tax=Catenulispora subtropica TaxID=450798 RepID=A0ABP5D421_9ACTN
MSQLASRRVIVTAATAASVALLATACAKSTPQSSSGPAPAPAAASTSVGDAAPVAVAGTPSPAAPAPAAATPQYAAGTPLLSDGSRIVMIGGTPVTFPTEVSEAAWSPDGSRVAFIDGAGNVATARPDGSSLVVMAKPDQGSKLSTPAWRGGAVLYTEQNAAGTHFVRQARVAGQLDHSDSQELYTIGPDDVHDIADTSNPAGAENVGVEITTTSVLFQTHGAKGPEVWFHQEDSTARGGVNPALKLTDGAWPALSTDGKVAFVGTGGQIDVLASDSLYTARNAKPVKIGDGAASVSHLAWTPDGKKVAYSTADGIMEISVDQPGAAQRLSSKPGVVSFLPAAADEVVTLSGSSPTDLVGASIAASRHRWLTQTKNTPAPAGAGPRGPWAMSVTIVAADDPATAQKELSWAGLYGPTLLTTGHDAFDTRLTAEIKRVLGAKNTDAQVQQYFPALDSVYLVGAPGAIPASADAAVKALGFKPVRVTTAPKPDPAHTDPATVAIVDQGDTAAANEAKAEGCRVMTLSGGKLSSSDSAYLTGLDTNYTNSAPRIIAFGDKAEAAANTLRLKRFAPPAEARSTTHADFVAASADAGPLTIVPSTSPTDFLLASLSVPATGYHDDSVSTVIIDPAQGISPTLKALLDERSADVDEVDVVDSSGTLSPALLGQISTLISGPLGAQSIANQTADALLKARQK